jgi:hypothetical protein
MVCTDALAYMRMLTFLSSSAVKLLCICDYLYISLYAIMRMTYTTLQIVRWHIIHSKHQHTHSHTHTHRHSKQQTLILAYDCAASCALYT